MEEKHKYDISMDINYGSLEIIDTPVIIGECEEKWQNRTLCRINNSLVRLGVFNEGEFHWHKHDNEDEFFFVLSGELFIELEGRTAVLKKHQGMTVPKGIMHRPFVKAPASVIMVEGDSVSPTGD